MKTLKTVIYYRVSTEKQGVSGLGLEAQKAMVDSYLSNNPHKVIGTFTEVESGKKNNRKALTEAIALAKATNSVLLIAKLDRLARNVAFTANLMESGVKFQALDIPNTNNLTIHIMASVAEDEAKRISERTKKALAAKKARGEQVGNPLIYKYAIGGTEAAKAGAKAKADEFASRVMPAIEAAKKQGFTSLRQIASYLNEHGFETPRGKQFTATAVKNLIARDC